MVKSTSRAKSPRRSRSPAARRRSPARRPTAPRGGAKDQPTTTNNAAAKAQNMLNSVADVTEGIGKFFTSVSQGSRKMSGVTGELGNAGDRLETAYVPAAKTTALEFITKDKAAAIDKGMELLPGVLTKTMDTQEPFVGAGMYYPGSRGNRPGMVKRNAQ